MGKSKLLLKITLVLILVSLLCSLSYAEEPKTDKRPALPFNPRIIKFETQCGPENDLQDVELYDGALGVTKDYVKSNEISTVQFQWLTDAAISGKLPTFDPGNIAGVRWCTGTLIAKNRVLTAGHCFDIQKNQEGWISPFTIDTNGNTQYADSQTLATLQQVNFHFQKNPSTGAERTSEVFPIVKLLEYRKGDNQLDYAIVELGPGNDGKLPEQKFQAAAVLTRSPIKDELISIIQHPQGLPKKVGVGKVLEISGNNFFYNNIDTWGGSSGSGIRDSHGAIIGVHTNGGCTEQEGVGANRGIPTSLIAPVSDIL